jgi:RimJ/RimL family protein N-acetyltransferase
MLYIARRLKDLDFRQLMDIYEEGNLENAAELWPEEPQGQQLLLVEQSFHQYLRECFFSTEEALYCVWVENDRYVSALRLEPYQDGLLLEALETRPDQRRKGYAVELVKAVLSEVGDTKIYSHVGKRNSASLKTHEKCGFRRILEHAVYADGSVMTNHCTFCSK